MPIRLSKPKLSHEADYKEMIQEFIEAGVKIQPTAMAPIDNETYIQLLERLDQQEKWTYKQDIYVPASLYFIIEETTGKIVGAIHIRHILNDFLRNFGGHVGYGIRPSERKKWYATQGLKAAIPLCKELGIEKIMVDCRKDNIWSSKTIQNNGGIFQYEFEHEGSICEKRMII